MYFKAGLSIYHIKWIYHVKIHFISLFIDIIKNLTLELKSTTWEIGYFNACVNYIQVFIQEGNKTCIFVKTQIKITKYIAIL